jgi:hypothetical protein
MIHDSFTAALRPFLSEHFRRIVYLQQHTFDCGVIEREHPDVVLHEIVERYLGLVPPDDTRFDDGVPEPARARTIP